MPDFVAAIDQGTTSTRCIIFDRAGSIVAADQKEHAQIFPQAGWVEHDALEIWARVQEVVAGALRKSKLSAADQKLFAATSAPGSVTHPAPALPEPHASWVPLIEAAWLERYGA